MTDYLCDDCKDHFEELQKALHAFGVPFVLDPFIVRGLDYYTKTAFEVVAKTGGSQNAVAGGGRYDNLVSDIGGSETPATGFAMGLERLFDLIPEDFYKETPLSAGYALCDEAVLPLVEFTKKMTGENVRFLAEYKPRKLKKALQKAEKANAAFVFVIGEDEAANGKILMKNMASREQKLFDKDDIQGIIKEMSNH
jgi:histidyl-tRNA synthetase